MSQVDSVSPVQQVRDERAPAPKFRTDIEGLRGVTLLAILLFHVDMPGVGGGFVGPDIFFIISGFVITGQLWKEVKGSGAIRLRKFYAGRARRLLPVSALVGVATVIASAIWLPPLENQNVFVDGIACALYVGNYRFALQGVDYFAADRPPSPFQHYWTLGVEEQFYLLWPVILAVTTWLVVRARARRRGGAHTGFPKLPYLVVIVVIAGGSFAVSLVESYWTPPMAYFSLQTRAWDLAIGALIAFTATQWGRLPAFAATMTSWAGFALIVLSCNQLRTTMPYPGMAALLPMLGTVLVIGAGCSGSLRGCGRILSWAPMRAIGRLSYSWYLWHWPVLVIAPALLGHPLGLFGKLVAVLFSGGLAMLTLRFVENPLRYAARLRRSPAASIAVGAAATALAACVAVAAMVVIPAPIGRSMATQTLNGELAPPLEGGSIEQYNAAVRRAYAQVQAAVAASADLEDVPSNLDPALADAAAEKDRMLYDGCLNDAKEVEHPECAMADITSATTVALLGDSNAAMWTPGFQRVASDRGWRLEMLTKGRCPVLDLPVIAHGRRYVECDQWRARIIERLQTEHPKLIVYTVRRGYREPTDAAWTDSITRFMRQLRGTGARVLVLGPIPDPHLSPPDCLAQHLDNATACSPLRSAAVNDSLIAAEKAAVEAGGGQYADVTDLFCTAERCPVIVGNTLVHFNESHLTLEYAGLMAPVLATLTDRTLAGG
ncbi:acyltransferase family protein [Mycobacterium paraterrae]|uniref:Acyltransferase n=1 Tax=Mycobacterium paraterrae TaxID=577492 RepID=A0ABY3VPD9_9MYCO|nr:acyltransferase family protein [Mycobacterium paraterrae]UMB69031.1 acyltransferase [Mycobacterium paraterrae]